MIWLIFLQIFQNLITFCGYPFLQPKNMAINCDQLYFICLRLPSQSILQQFYYMINCHNTGNHTSEIESIKEPILKNTLSESFILKNENSSDILNRITVVHNTSEPIYIKVGKPLRVVLPNNTQKSQKKLIESMSIDRLPVKSKEKCQRQQNQAHLQHLQKIGTKLKHKLNCQVQQSHQIQNKEDSHLVSTSESNFQNAVDQQNFFEFKDWVSSQISKINQKIKIHGERIDILFKQSEIMEQNQVFSGPQMEELNRILALVEKAGNREDYKRTTRMIEELRSNILELHQQLSSLSQKNCREENFSSEAVQELIKKNLKKQLNLDNMNKLLENYKSQDEQIKKVEATLAYLQQELEQLSNKQEIKVGHKKFQGQMVTLRFIQKIGLKNNVETKVPCSDEKIEGVENNNQEITIFENIYHIDTEGYLLDSQGYYLLNNKQEQIRLTSREMDLLKASKII